MNNDFPEVIRLKIATLNNSYIVELEDNNKIIVPLYRKNTKGEYYSVKECIDYFKNIHNKTPNTVIILNNIYNTIGIVACDHKIKIYN